MSRSLTALWAALLAAIALILALAFIWNGQRSQLARQRVEELMQLQLEPFRRSVAEVLEGYSLALQRQMNQYDPGDLQQCVELTRSPLVDEVVVINAAAQLHFPRDNRLSTDRQSLVDEALQLLREQADPRPARQADNSPTQVSDLTAMRATTYASQVTNGAAAEERAEGVEATFESSDAVAPNRQAFGWATWYHRRGIIVGIWWEQAPNWRTMLVLPRARWMSDVVARLPESQTRDVGPGQKYAPQAGDVTQLVDVEGRVVYQWGTAPSTSWDSLLAHAPTASVSLAEPLEGWRLRVFANAELQRRLAGESWLAPLMFAVGASVLAILLVGVLVTLNVNRELRLAASRVSFVNQVSHELRTPLTNIRMYADLLAQSLEALPAEDGSSEHEMISRVAVIQGESQRLSRLIGNVLEFARPTSTGQRRRVSAVLDHLVEDVLATFRPRLERAGFEIDLRLHTPEQRLLDIDAVEQILVNLIGNAEKYAAAGRYLLIRTQPNTSGVIIDVQDRGPGILPEHQERVFEPFVRLYDGLEDPTGTGIGLTIVRRLAEEHGGSCELVTSSEGAHFRCYLSAELT